MNENTLTTSTVGMVIERITQRSANKGTYVFQILDNVASMHYFQDRPKDEATEETTILEETFDSPKIALCRMIELYQNEKTNNFPGYDKKKKAVRVRDFDWSLN
jgi:hypothetical protein